MVDDIVYSPSDGERMCGNDIFVIIKMSSMSGYITYIEYQYASNKGGTKKGDLISNPFGFGNVDTDFTGSRVVETVDSEGQIVFAWKPQAGTVKFLAEGATEYVDLPADKDENGNDLGTYTAPGAGKVAYV